MRETWADSKALTRPQEKRIDRIKRRRFNAWIRWERLNVLIHGSLGITDADFELLRRAFDWIMIWDGAYHYACVTVKRARSVGE